MLLLTCNEAASFTTVLFGTFTGSSISSEARFMIIPLAVFTLSFSSSEPVPNTTLALVKVPVAPSRPVSVPCVVVPPLITNGNVLLE
ncbi:hypothetical protein D3C75_865310 [compost metagenome]